MIFRIIFLYLTKLCVTRKRLLVKDEMAGLVNCLIHALTLVMSVGTSVNHKNLSLYLVGQPGFETGTSQI